MITEYFVNFDNINNKVDFISDFKIRKRKLNEFLGIIEGRVIIENNILEIFEVIQLIDNKLTKKKYKYHFQKQDNSLIFRYDNAPHHSDINSFQNNKHLPDKIISSDEPNLLRILSEIKDIIR